MKKILLIFSLILFFSSCVARKGEWIEGRCRPKKTNFKLLKTPHVETDLLVYNRVYTLNGENKNAINFYKNGRFVLFFDYNENIQEYQSLSQNFIKNNDWANARFIGYWRFINDQVHIEYFVCGNSGNYIRKQGKIKGDTIFFERNCGSKPFKREICYDKYILSSMNFD